MSAQEYEKGVTMGEIGGIKHLSLVGEGAMAVPVRYTGAEGDGASEQGFTEDQLSPEHQELVNQATAVIHTCMLNIAQNIFEIGQQLVRVKQIVKHGHFLDWIHKEFGLKERTAQHWMNVYLRLGTKARVFRQVKPTALCYLAMPSTPQKAIAIVEEMILAGKRLSVQQVMAIIAACRTPLQPEALETVAARLTKAVGKASAWLSNRTVADCERVLGEEAAGRLDEVRTELAELLEQVQPFLPRLRRRAPQEWTVMPDSGTITPGDTVHGSEGDAGRQVSSTLGTDTPGDPDYGCSSGESLLGKETNAGDEVKPVPSFKIFQSDEDKTTHIPRSGAEPTAMIARKPSTREEVAKSSLDLTPRPARSALTSASGFLAGFTHTLNPYVGCRFGCAYCYVQGSPVHMCHNPPIAWGEYAHPKIGIAERLEQELARLSKGELDQVAIFMSSATDPYQGLERRWRLSRACLEIMLRYPPGLVVIQTRSPFVQDDFSLLQQLGQRCWLSFTVETDVEQVRQAVTPRCPSIAQRWAVLQAARDLQLNIQIPVSPCLPYSSVETFGSLLLAHSQRVIVDTYTSGDGAGGKRTAKTVIPALYQELGWGNWRAAEAAQALYTWLNQHIGDQAGWSQAGFTALAQALKHARPVA